MSAGGETARAAAVELLEIAQGTLSSLPAPGAMVLVLAGAALLSLPLLRARPSAPAHRARSLRARELAARGVSRTQIARETGLSHDAISLLMYAAAVGGEQRRILPVPAQVAAPGGPAGRQTLGPPVR